MDQRTTHYDQTVLNFAALGSGDLHFVGYFENDDETLVQALANVNRLIAQYLSAQPSSRILDIGCGTGGPAMSVARASGCRVTGIDLGETQIRTACEAAQRSDVSDRVEFLVGDGLNLPFEDGQFDGIYLLGSASHVAPKGELFQECARVTRPDAKLVLADVTIPSEGWLKQSGNALVRRIVNHFFASPHLCSSDEYQHLLAGAGFEIDSTRDLTSHVSRSARLWEAELRENEERLAAALGSSQWKSMLRAIQVFGEAAEKNQFGATIIRARRKSES